MECRTLDIKVKSAKDLKDVNRFSKMDVYVVVKIAADDDRSKQKQKQKTPVDKDGGTNPKWNYPLKFIINEDAAQRNRLTLKFKLVSDRSFGDKEIGKVSVPVKQLLDGYNGDEKSEKFVSYKVKTTAGKEKGTLDFSYEFGDKFVSENIRKIDEPVMAYPAGGNPGASSAYPPPAGVYYPPPPAGGYYQTPPQHAPGYPPSHAAGYAGYGYPPQGGYPPHAGQGYGYAAPPPGYAYAAPAVQKPKKKKNGNFGLGLGAGLLGGLLVGDMVSDVGEMGAYDGGMDDGGDFDF